MPRLFLLRHAKAAWGAPGVPDFDRPLTPEGMRAARAAGAALEAGGCVPDAVLCSPALRTRQTFEGVASAFRAVPPVRFVPELYDGGAGAYLDALRTLGGVPSALLVGHNPMTEDVGEALVSDGDQASLEALRGGFPVCGMAVIDFEAPWAAVGLGAGRLVSFAVHEG